MLPSSTKLTLLQRGLAQKCAVFCTYIISITVIAFILDWLDKKTFLKIVHEVHKQGSISEQVVNAFTILIESRDGIFFLNFIFIGIICGVVGLLNSQSSNGQNQLFSPRLLNSNRPCSISVYILLKTG